MTKNTANPKNQNSKQHDCSQDQCDTEKAVRGTPIETYKGDPDAERSSDVGDLEEETLDRDAPFNKTYGIKDE